MPSDYNPCLACTLERNCCQKLEGIKVTRSEYERVFEAHKDQFDITDHGEWLELSDRAGKPCPHWDVQCTIHDKRPIECALYPHTISEIAKRGNAVTVTYHSRTACPLKTTLKSSDRRADALVRSFAEQAFGPDCHVTVIEETGTGFLKALPLKLARKLSRPLTGANPPKPQKNGVRPEPGSAPTS